MPDYDQVRDKLVEALSELECRGAQLGERR